MRRFVGRSMFVSRRHRAIRRLRVRMGEGVLGRGDRVGRSKVVRRDGIRIFGIWLAC